MNAIPFIHCLRVLVCSLCWLAASSGVHAAKSQALRPAQEAARLAVFYDLAEEYAPGAYATLLREMESSPNVVVFRVALNSQGQEVRLAAFPSAPPIKLAAATVTGTGNVAVLYPEIGEPFRSVFSKIIEGVEERASKNRVLSYAIGPRMNLQDLSQELRKQEVRVVIALGRNGLKAATMLGQDNLNIVAGGVLAVPDAEARRMAVFSLAPDPALLMNRLKMMSPGMKRVHVVYDPRQNDWLISLAREAAKAQGLELVAQEALDLKAAVAIYQTWLATADPKRDVLWLPQDSTTVDENTVLPLVLQESWNRSLTVFSSSLGHVKRGALFSLYPDNVELGRNLARSALSTLASPEAGARGMQPLREVLVAVNVRTAGHLGLDLGRQALQNFNMVFPEL